MALRDIEYIATVLLIHFAPRALLPLIVKGLGYAAYHLSREKRRVMETNLEIAFGKTLDERQKRMIVRGAMEQVWKEMFELSLPPPEPGDLKIVVRGLEHLHAALEQGKGVILWESNSFGSRTLAKRILNARGLPVHQIHGPDNLGGFLAERRSESRLCRDWIRPFFDTREARFVSELIYLPDDNSLLYTRTLLERLQQNAILCVAGDGRFGKKLIRLHFLGQPVSFATGMSSLARLAGAPILILLCVQERDSRVCLRVGPPLKVEGKRSVVEAIPAALAEYAEVLEAEIRRHPEMYRNWHLVGTSGKMMR